MLSTKAIVGIVAALGLGFAGTQFATSGKCASGGCPIKALFDSFSSDDCCAPTSECCDLQKSCCDSAKPKVEEKISAKKPAFDCCSPASDCCDTEVCCPVQNAKK